MRNLNITSLTVLILATTLSNCAKESNIDESIDETIEEKLGSISFNYYLDNPNIEDQCGHVYLTDSNGNIVSDTSLIAGESSYVEADFESGIFNLSVINKIAQGTDTLYRIQTFMDVKPTQYEITEAPDFNPQNKEAILYIQNSGGLTDFCGEGYSQAFDENIDGYVVKKELGQLPNHLYSSFKKGNENFKKYAWIENVDENFRDTVLYKDLPTTEGPITIQYPANNGLVVSISGKTSPMQEKSYALIDLQVFQTTSQTSHYIPFEVFNRFQIVTSLFSQKMSYQKTEETDEIKSSFTLPNLHLEVSSSSGNNFSFNITGNYDVLSNRFTYTKEPEKRIIWTVLNMADETIEYSLPNLFDLLITDFPNLRVEEMVLTSSQIEKYREPLGYLDRISTDLGETHHDDPRFVYPNLEALNVQE